MNLTGRVVVLTGAGFSAPSGLPTFRGAGGLYEGRDVTQLASPEGFAQDPELVWRWYSGRIEQLLQAEPNPAHLALAKWEQKAERLTVITSNVDDLHERAGQKRLFKLHGRILEARCLGCHETTLLATPPASIPFCRCGSMLRPNVVWFGERPWPDAVEAAVTEIPSADLLVEVGVSGAVTYGLTEMALEQGVPVLRINPEESYLDRWCAEVMRDSVDAVLPALVEPL